MSAQGHPLVQRDNQEILEDLLTLTQDDLDYLTLDEWRRGIANVAFMDAQALKQRQADDTVLPDALSPQERARRVEAMKGVLP